MLPIKAPNNLYMFDASYFGMIDVGDDKLVSCFYKLIKELYPRFEFWCDYPFVDFAEPWKARLMHFYAHPKMETRIAREIMSIVYIYKLNYDPRKIKLSMLEGMLK